MEQEHNLVLAKTNLPATVKKALKDLLTSPKAYYRGLQKSSIKSILTDTPELPISELATIKYGDINAAQAIVAIAISEVVQFFNVGKTMNDIQVAITSDLIIDRFYYFKLEEIKYCFHRAMCSGKVYDRLDGNIIIGWLNDYDAERDEFCSLNIINENKAHKADDKSSISCPYDEFWDNQHKLAEAGEEAIERVKFHEDLIKKMREKKSFVSQPFIVRQIQKEENK